MIKKFLLAITAAFIIQPAFAHMGMMENSAACDAVSKACMDAGYSKDDGDKKFWQDCMKPLLMNKKVTDVKIDAKTVNTCRSDKIKEMKEEIKELQKAS